jgi:hypothetical protein
MANSLKKIDFKEEHLSVDTIVNASKWNEQLGDEFVHVGLSQQLSDGPSLEERVKTAQVKVDATESKEAKREKIEEIPVKDRTDGQREQLKTQQRQRRRRARLVGTPRCGLWTRRKTTTTMTSTRSHGDSTSNGGRNRVEQQQEEKQGRSRCGSLQWRYSGTSENVTTE